MEEKRRRIKINPVKHFWQEDFGMSTMLGIILIGNFILAPASENYHYFKYINQTIFILITVSGIWFLVKKKRYKIMGIVVPIAYLTLSVLNEFYENIDFNYLMLFLLVSTFIILIFLCMTKVFEAGPINTQRIVGSLFVFMLIGNLFSNIYDFFYLYFPGSFNIPAGLVQNENPHSALFYFSFTTLTTTGYGDITPIRPYLRSLVILEQLIGLMYPILLIGRLVSLNISTKE